MYVCAAGLFWAMARVLREGLTVRRGLAVGGTLVLGIFQAQAALAGCRDQLELLGMPNEAIDELEKTKTPSHSVSQSPPT